MMPESQTKWYDDFNWGGVIFMMIIVVTTIITFSHGWDYIFPNEMKEVRTYIQSVEDGNIKRGEMISKYDSIARNSDDCQELKQVQLDLLSYGVNPDAWFPRMSDNAIKIAKERYEVLCK